jgi:hypothetical protein
MKLIIFITIFITAYSYSIYAQKSSSYRKINYINVGIGINPIYGFGFPASFSYDRKILKNVSVGLLADYFPGRVSIYAFTPRFKVFYPGIRASYHLNEALNIKTRRIDLYFGALTGYRLFSWGNKYGNDVSNYTYSNRLFTGGYIGLRYYTGKRLGFYTETGSVGSAIVKLGMTAKF